MSSKLAVQVAEIKKRVEALETMQPVAGPRGPAGDVTAAVANSEATVAKMLDGHAKSNPDHCRRILGQCR
jgi:hypothetical protein